MLLGQPYHKLNTLIRYLSLDGMRLAIWPSKRKKHSLNRTKRTRAPIDVLIFKRCRPKARRVILEAKQSSWENFYNALTSNSKLSTVWNVIKKLSGHHPQQFFPSLRQGSITACNNQHKANMLATQFQSVSSTSNYELAFCCTMLVLKWKHLKPPRK